MKSLCRDGGEESSLCALSSHLLPLFICTEAGRMEGEGGEEEEGGLHVFLPGSATLSPGCWGERRRREARQTEGSAGDVKPDLLSSFLPSSLLLFLLQQCHLAREPPRLRVI